MWRRVMPKILPAYLPLQSKWSLHRDSYARGSSGRKQSASRIKQDTQATAAYFANLLNNFS